MILVKVEEVVSLVCEEELDSAVAEVISPEMHLPHVVNLPPYVMARCFLVIF